MIRFTRTILLLGSVFLFALLVLHSTHRVPSIRKEDLHSLAEIIIAHKGTKGVNADEEPKKDNPLFKSSSETGGIGVHVPGPNTSQFVAGDVNVHGSNYTRTLVIGKLKEEDTGWIYTEDLGYINRMIYIVNDRSAPLHTPKNKGHEVMVYFSYIVDNYDNLPDVSIFMHSHQYAWHNNDLLNNNAAEMIKRLSSERVVREGYMNMRCHWMPGCPSWMHPHSKEYDAERKEQDTIAKIWHQLFPATQPLPEVLAQPCCAQFALSRDRIRAIPRERYEHYRKWLLKTKLDDWLSGRVFEYIWQMIFTGHSTYCPNQWSCYCDGYGVCFENETTFDYWFQLKWRVTVKEGELAEWREKADMIERYSGWRRLLRIGRRPLENPELGKDRFLTDQIQSLHNEMEESRRDALARGTDPGVRAASVGRAWSQGDGY